MLLCIDNYSSNSCPLDASLDDVDEAHVRTSQELHGINAVILSKSGLHVPLTCIVDYKGFRVVCYADMSNGRGSVGGGDNAAATTAAGPSLVHEITSELPRINEEGANKLSIVGRYLNLKPHAVMLQDDRRVTVHTGAGVQVRISREEISSSLSKS